VPATHFPDEPGAPRQYLVQLAPQGFAALCHSRQVCSRPGEVFHSG
jgi:hypothetical protein